MALVKETVIELVTSIGTVGTLAVIAFQQWHSAKLSRFAALSDLNKEIGTARFRKALTRIFHASDEELLVLKNAKSFNDLDSELIEAIEAVCQLYDLVGARVQERVLPKKGTLKTEWKVLVLLWPLLENFIQVRADGRGTPYKEHLKWLYEKAKEYQENHKEYRYYSPRINRGEGNIGN